MVLKSVPNYVSRALMSRGKQTNLGTLYMSLVIAQKKKMKIFFCLLPLKECSLTQSSLDTNAVQAIKVTRK